MKRVALFFIILFFIGCASAPPSIYKHPEFIKNKNKVYKIAVLPFKDAKGSPDSGKTMADIFETTLLTSGKFEVVERMQLEKVLNEQGLNLSGLGVTLWAIDDSASGMEAGVNDGGPHTTPDVIARILCRKMIKGFIDN
ncbi:MAG: hypothetical protein HY096_16040 [Nitrospinae bacterium]|nr:hypothetical protein [Nitrospinota bacterium]